MIEVTIYSKPGCHLCDVAKAVLLKVQRREPFVLREINIEDDPATFEAYRESIPVIFVAGHKAFKFRVTEDEFRERLRRERQLRA